jgi:hypothetical protein
MRFARYPVLILVFPFLAHPCFAQQTTISVRRDPQALTLIAQSLSTMGALASPTRMTTAQGVATYPDGTTKAVSMETIGNNCIRHDLGTNEFTFVSNAGSGFLVLNGKRSKLPYWVTAYQRPEHLPALSLISDNQNPSLQVQYVGLENINGSPAHHLRLSMLPTDATPAVFEDLISEFHVWIDQATLLVVKSRHFDFSPEAIQNRTPVDILYSEYRQQDGALVPFHLTRYVAGQKQCDIELSSISLSAAVSASDFQ